jgi:RimJ/RimL family protein N-acetyltransferase
MTEVHLSLRRAVDGDCAVLFEWANDPLTRANSFTPGIISWQTHCEWFTNLLRDPDRWLYLVTTPGDTRIGQARFERCGEREAEVSLSLAVEWRGRGIAARVIRLATERAMGDAGFETVHAYVKPANDASRRAFVRAGYAERGLTDRKGFEAVHLIVRRP